MTTVAADISRRSKPFTRSSTNCWMRLTSLSLADGRGFSAWPKRNCTLSTSRMLAGSAPASDRS